MTAASDAFFAQLPAKALSEKEEELLWLLQRITVLMNEFLPRSVGLQAWAQKRLPADLADTVNGSGIIFIQPKQQSEPKDKKPPMHRSHMPTPPVVAPPPKQQSEPKDKKPPIHRSHMPTPPVVAPPTVVAPPKRRQVAEVVPPPKRPRVSDVQNISSTSQLPVGKLLAEEESLRQSLLSFRWRQSTMSCRKIERSPEVQEAFAALQLRLQNKKLKLEDWIMERAPNNFGVCHDKRGDAWITRKPLSEEDRHARLDCLSSIRAEFFSSLPDDEFTFEETILRQELLDFLDNFQGEYPATLSQASQTVSIGAARQACLPQGVSLQSWCEQRLGQEVELALLDSGQIGLSRVEELAP